MSDLNNLGSFSSIDAVWARYPEGGKEGDYLTIGGVKYRWNKYDQIWENAATVTETTTKENKTFEGEVDIHKDLHIGKNATVEGNARVKGNLDIDGMLRAKGIRQPNCGLFDSLEALQAAIPNPEVGQWAAVGNTIPAPLYRCTTAGVWTTTGESGGAGNFDLSSYDTRITEALEEAQRAQSTANENGTTIRYNRLEELAHRTVLFSGFISEEVQTTDAPQSLIVTAPLDPYGDKKVLYDTINERFLLHHFGSDDYWHNWNGREYFSDENGKPYQDKLYILNVSGAEKIFFFNGMSLHSINVKLGLNSGEAFPGNEGSQLAKDVRDLRTETNTKINNLIINVSLLASLSEEPIVFDSFGSLLDYVITTDSTNITLSSLLNSLCINGTIVTYLTTEGWESKQFQGGNISQEGSWKNFGNGGGAVTGNIVNVNEIAPKADGYYNRGTAANAIPEELRTSGRKITFMSAANKWQTWQFVGTKIEDWADETCWFPEIQAISFNGSQPIAPDRDGTVNLEYKVDVDEQLNKESKNPIANQTVTAELENIQKGLAAGLSVDPATRQLSLLDAEGGTMGSVTLPEGGGGNTNPTAIELVIDSGMSGILKENDPYAVEFTWRHYNINTNVDTQYGGRAELIVNGSSVESKDVVQGITSFEVGKWLSVGTNSVRIKITADDGLIAQSAYIKLTVVTLNIASSYSLATITEKGTAIPFRYVVTGSGTKVVNFVLDDTPLDTETITSSGATSVKTIDTSALSHGSHSLVVYAEREISDGVMLTSNVLYFDLMVTQSGNSTVLIATEWNASEVEQYKTITIPFAVYNPNSVTSSVDILINGVLNTSMDIDRSRQTWSYRAKNAGEYIFTIRCGSVERNLAVTVTEADTQINAESDALALYLSSSGRSNSATNKDDWSFTSESGDIVKAEFINCGFDDQSGWKADANGLVSLHLAKGAQVHIPYMPFATDCKNTGKTIEIEFSSSNCYDQEAVLISCLQGIVGFVINAQECYMQSALKKKVSTKFKQNERIRVGFVIQSVAEKRFIFLFLNGIMSNVIQYDTSDYFVQNPPVGITFGNESCELDIYNIRVYDNALAYRQMIDNYIADMDDTDVMFKKLEENNILNEDSAETEIEYDKVVEKIPCITFIGALPSYKGDKKKDTKIIYEDRLHPEFSFTCGKTQNDVQGTSSQYYPRKNWKFKFLEDIVYTQSGATSSKYALRGLDGLGNTVKQKAVKTFCLKADFAESSGTHNTGAANFINEVLVDSEILTPPQKVDSTVRTTINGFPILMFHQESETSPRVFIGKYNFNNDKSTQDTFGFEKIAGYNKGMINRDDYLLYGGTLAQLQADAEALADADDDGEYLMYLIDNDTDDTYYRHLVEYDTTAGSWIDKGELWMWDAYNKHWTNRENLSFTDGLTKVADGYLVENNVECWEFTNNGNAMCLFHASDFISQVYGDDIPDWFDTDWLPTDAEGKKHAPYWATAFEPRYPDNDNMFKHYAQGRIPKQLKRICDWLASLNILDENLTEAEKAAMDARFVAEYQQYFHKEALLSYDLIREGLLCADQGAKNMMWAFFDGLCYPIFYDNDTILGLNNEGRNQFHPYVEPHDKDSLGKFVFNGESSVIWNLIERNLEAEKNVIYERMVSQGGFTYERALYWFNTRQSDMWSETVYNEDGKYKYIDSYGSASEEDGSAQDYLEIAQGSREEHRKWMLYERFAYLNSKRCTGTYRESSVYLRANTNGESSVPYDVSVNVTAAQDWYFGFRFSGNAGYSSRLLREGESHTFTAPANSVPNDTETYIYQADRIRSLGDLSPLYPTTLVVGACKLLDELIVGNETEGYIGKLATLTLGTHPLLKRINVINCPTLQSSLGLTGCSALEELYAQGSKITAVNLPVGSIIKYMHLPDTLVQLLFDRLPNLTYNNLVIDGYANIQTVNIVSCPKLDAMKVLEDIMNTPNNSLQYVRVTDIDLEGDGQVLLDMMHLKGADNKNGAPELIGKYTLTRYMNEEDYNKIVECYPYLQIINQQFTLLCFDDTEEDEANVSNMDNKTGYLFSDETTDVPFEPSGYILEILNKRHAVLGKYQGNKTMLVCQLDDTNRAKYYDGTAANLKGDRDETSTDEGDVFMYEPRYWYKGINDYLNNKKYHAYSSLVSMPQDAGLQSVKVALADLDKFEGMGLAITNLVEGSTVEDSLKTYDTYNVYKINVEGLKMIRWVGIASGTYCSAFADAEGKCISSVKLTSNNGYVNGDYLFMEVPEAAVWFYFTAPKEIDTNLYADYCVKCYSTNVAAVEPDWVLHEECLCGVYEANYSNDIMRSISGVNATNNLKAGDYVQYAMDRGDGFQVIDYEMHKDVANLFYAKYGRRDSQKQCGYGTGNTASVCGYTDMLGMTDTINPNNATTGGFYYKDKVLTKCTSVNVMGYENWQGDSGEWMSRVGIGNGAIVTDSLGTNRTTKAEVWQIKMPDDTTREVQGITASDKYIIRVRNGRFMDIIASYCGGTSSTYYCDYQWYSSSASRVVLRSSSYAYANGGVAFAHAGHVSSDANASHGSRLAFRGKIQWAASVTEYKEAGMFA